MHKSKRPSVSVIVPSLNHPEELELTIKSYINQDYKFKELIIIDGGSNIQTLEIINKYKGIITYSISEKDDGISDAFNKGLLASNGDYLYFMGTGDVFWSDNVLEYMMSGIDAEKDIFVFGRINRLSSDGKRIIYSTGIKFKKWHLLYKMAIPHQALFTNKSYFAQYGKFNLKYKFAMDYDLILRSYKHFPIIIVKNILVAGWKEGGVGTGKIINVLDEYHQIREDNHIASKLLLDIIYWSSRLRYLI